MPYDRILFSNGAESTLASGIAASSGATTIVLAAGTGTRFPTPLNPGDYFVLSLVNADLQVEIVKVTARVSDTLTVVRGWEGSTIYAFSANDTIALAPTAGIMQGLASSDGWSRETNGITYLSSSTFAVAGNQTGTYVANRAIRLTQTTNATGYVLSSTYGTSTTVTVYGVTVDSGLAGVDFGLDPASLLYVGNSSYGLVRLSSIGKLPAVDGSQLTGISTADQVARDQIALTNMRLLLNSSVASGALIQGRMWELLTDEWGATSTNEVYIPGAPGYYSNQSRTATSSPASGWTTYGAQIALTLGQWVSGTTNSGCAHGYNSAALTGDFDFTYTISASSSSADGGIQFGVSTAALTTTYPSLYEAGNGTDSWWFSHAGIGSNRTITLWHQHTSLATVTGVTIAAGDIFAIKRRGSALTLWRNGTQIGTFTGFSSTAALYPIGGLYYASYTLTAVSWTLIGALSTTTLINPTFTISAAGYLDAYFLYLDETGGAVAGTDFTCELSGNGGTNYYTATLTTPLGAAGYDGTYTLYKARAAIPVTGTSLKARITLNNTKVQRVATPSIYAE